ncbi:retrovirus-related pol polyprotein from transposon TNT 1-94 [Tanacetum coccineum]
MSTQQDIYAAGSENRPHMLNKENYVPWSSRLLRLLNRNVGNQNGYNAVQNVRNQVVQNAVQNPGVQNVGNQNGLIIVLVIANQNLNENGNVVAAQAEGNAIGNNGNQIRCYNCKGLGHLARNCTVRPRRMDAAYLQT